MKVDYNPYEGREVTGVTDTVISRGKVIIDKGKFTGRAGDWCVPAQERARLNIVNSQPPTSNSQAQRSKNGVEDVTTGWFPRISPPVRTSRLGVGG